MKTLQVVAVMVFLVIGTMTDIKNKRIPVWLLAGFGVISVVLNAVSSMFLLKEFVIGVMVGVLLILISIVTGGQIGMGDSLLFAVLGMYLGSSNVMLLIMSLALCAVTAGILFATKRVKKKDRLPFVPFVLCAYIMQQLLLAGV